MPRGAGNTYDHMSAAQMKLGDIMKQADRSVSRYKEASRVEKDAEYDTKRKAREVAAGSAKLSKPKTAGQKLGDWAGRRLQTAKKNVQGVKAALGSDSAAAAIKDANKGLAGAVKESGRRKSTNVKDKRKQTPMEQAKELDRIYSDYEDPETSSRPLRHSSPANKYAVKRSAKPDTLGGSGAVNYRPQPRPGPADPGYKKPPRGKIDWTPPRPKKRPRKASS